MCECPSGWSATRNEASEALSICGHLIEIRLSTGAVLVLVVLELPLDGVLCFH